MRYVRQVSLAVSLIVSSTICATHANPTSNVKPIPKAFIGKWAGLHSTKQKVNKTILKDLCDNGGEQDTSFFVDFNSDGQRLTGISYWEDSYEEYPISYSKYTPNHISGQSLSVAFEMGEEDLLSNKHVGKFDYKITNGTLYLRTDNTVIEMMRCR
ncbi:hypothetical protein ES754_04120 [Psychrobacter frigidicola]|uniref:DUF1579 domain-containing protein n=1 Tax=Psychrobacter frigidicola TaxID=45611 RepID=A0A5C7A6M2_9GAMM|nr:hypothetical protein [Psychrobacter frigidicola]TXD98134.1 hypothetical protein ES754_04120 [Psychrobacter frigidicola]